MIVVNNIYKERLSNKKSAKERYLNIYDRFKIIYNLDEITFYLYDFNLYYYNMSTLHYRSINYNINYNIKHKCNIFNKKTWLTIFTIHKSKFVYM